MTKKITIGLLLAVIAILGVWDIVAATNDTSGDTISEVILSWALGNPILPFAIGVVMGHLFWGQKRHKAEIGDHCDDVENTDDEPTVPS